MSDFAELVLNKLDVCRENLEESCPNFSWNLQNNLRIGTGRDRFYVNLRVYKRQVANSKAQAQSSLLDLLPTPFKVPKEARDRNHMIMVFDFEH
jgi:hypothetical protein